MCHTVSECRLYNHTTVHQLKYNMAIWELEMQNLHFFLQLYTGCAMIILSVIMSLHLMFHCRSLKANVGTILKYFNWPDREVLALSK